MRGAARCARRLKQLFRSLRTSLGKVPRLASGDPVTQLILGIFSRDNPESKAREALDRLRSMVVDYNELRVIAPIELAQSLPDYPDVRGKCEDLSRALNRIFAIEHTVGLDRLSNLSRKEARAYLERIDGLEPYTRGRIRLLALHHHAIPLDQAMWAYLQQTQVLDARAPLEEAQAFLERNIAEPDGFDFVALLKRRAWSEVGQAVRKGQTRPIQSVPPDRTSRNMLQLVSSAGPSPTSTREPLSSPDDLSRGAQTKVRSTPSPAGRGGQRSRLPKSRSKRPAPASSARIANNGPRPGTRRKALAQMAARRRPSKARAARTGSRQRRTAKLRRSTARAKSS